MKKIITLAFFTLALLSQSVGQTYNWTSISDTTKHIIHAKIGWEYSTFAELGYGYMLSTKQPLVLQTSISLPFGKNISDDFTYTIGLNGIVTERNYFKTSAAVNGVYRQYTNELVRLRNLGLELQAAIGFYKTRWFFACQTKFDLAMGTNFKHTETYRNTIYNGVKDGWYKPVSGGYLNLGIQGGYSFKRNDIVLEFGYIRSITSRQNVLISYYTSIGYNFKI